MAVSPVRALLAARAQSLFNQLRREAGGAGLAAAGLVGLLVVAALTAPTLGSFAVGRAAGSRLGTADGPQAALGLASFHALIIAGLGLLGGLFGGETGLALGSLRAYPVARRRLFVAELAASSVELPGLLAGGCLLGLAAGAALARPTLAPFVLLLALQGALWVQLAQQLLGGLRTTLLSRLQWAVGALAVAAACLVLLAGRATIRAAAGQLAGLATVVFLPVTEGYRGLDALAAGRVVEGLLRQLPPLLASGLLFQAALWLRFKQAEAEGEGRAGPARSIRLWTFKRPAGGVARLFASEVLRSRPGRIVLLAPALLVLMGAATGVAVAEARETAPHVLFDSLRAVFALPWLGLLPALCVMTSKDLWFNQFGWDGPGIKTLLLLPVPPRDLLLGKLLGLLRLTALQLALAMPTLMALRPVRLAELAWGLGAGGFALVTLGGLGHVFSAGLPFRAEGQGELAQGFSGMLMGAVLNAGAGIVLVLTYKGFVPLGPWGPALGMALLCGAAVAAYRRALGFLAARVMDLRETLLDALA